MNRCSNVKMLVSVKERQMMNKKQKKMLTRIIISAILMIALSFAPVEGALRFVLYMVPYLIIGYDILIKAA